MKISYATSFLEHAISFDQKSLKILVGYENTSIKFLALWNDRKYPTLAERAPDALGLQVQELVASSIRQPEPYHFTRWFPHIFLVNFRLIEWVEVEYLNP